MRNNFLSEPAVQNLMRFSSGLLLVTACLPSLSTVFEPWTLFNGQIQYVIL